MKFAHNSSLTMIGTERKFSKGKLDFYYQDYCQDRQQFVKETKCQNNIFWAGQ